MFVNKLLIRVWIRGVGGFYPRFEQDPKPPSMLISYFDHKTKQIKWAKNLPTARMRFVCPFKKVVLY